MEISLVSETSATWSVRGTALPSLDLRSRCRRGSSSRPGRCSNSQTSPTISSRSALSSRERRRRRISRSSTHRGGTACSSSRCARGPPFVVKQASAGDARRCARGRRAAPLAGMPAWRARCPAVVHHEPAERRLVLRTPAGGRDWSEHRGRFPRIPAPDARPHAGGAAPAPGDALERCPRTAMWALSLPEPPHELLARPERGGPGSRRPHAGRAGTVCAGCSELREAAPRTRSCTAISAGTNCLALGAGRRPPDARAPRRLGARGAGPGGVRRRQPCSASTWVPGSGRSRSSSPRDPGRLVAHARHPLTRMQPAMHASGRPTERPPRRAGAAARDRAGRGAAAADRGRARAGSHGPVRPRRDPAAARRQHAAPSGRGRPGAARAARVERVRYRDQIAAALGAVTIRGPTRLRWLGRRSRRAPAGARGRARRVRPPQLPRLVRCGRSSTRRSTATGAPVPARWRSSRAGRAIAGCWRMSQANRGAELGARLDG